jgi:hypothetical protein
MAPMKVVVAVGMAALVWASSAAGEEVTESTRSAARELAYTGVERYQAGDYQAALTKLDKAYRALRVPSLGLWSARAMVKLNSWVEASERLREVSAMEPTGGDAAVQKQAVADAAKELDALTPKLPKLVLDIAGAPNKDVTVTLDGRALPSALLG